MIEAPLATNETLYPKVFSRDDAATHTECHVHGLSHVQRTVARGAITIRGGQFKLKERLDVRLGITTRR